MKSLSMLTLALLLLNCAPRIRWLQPANFPESSYDFGSNPPTNAAIELGRALFYDPILSADGTISCSSCHSSYNAFAHTDHDLSHGIGDQIGSRNAPALINLAWHRSFMWDGAIHHLDAQALAPISHPKEMGSDMAITIRKLQKSSPYPKLYKNAYKTDSIKSDGILKALAVFQLTLVSCQSKYDSVNLNQTTFTTQEQNGYILFRKNCNSCHTEPLFTNHGFENNGLPMDTSLRDAGRFVITQLAEDHMKFKVPTLRNLSYTYPYMHDGRFHSLGQILNHYDRGISPTATVAKELRNGIPLTSAEKADLIAFLLTLNDKNFVRNEQFSYPKKLLSHIK